MLAETSRFLLPRETRGTRRRFLRRTRWALHLNARSRGYTQEQALEISDEPTDSQLEDIAFRALQEDDPDVTPLTFWDKVRKFLKEWGPIILKIVLTILPLLMLGKKPLGSPSPALFAQFEEFVTMLSGDDYEDGDDDPHPGG